MYKEYNLRTISEDDIPQLFSWWIDEELNKYDPRPMPLNDEAIDIECRIFCDKIMNLTLNKDKSLNDYKYFMITDKDSTDIGYINLFNFSSDKKVAELGITIGNKEYHRKGVASSSIKQVLHNCFNELGMKEIFVEIYEDNTPSIKLFKSLGFEDAGSIDDEGFVFYRMEKRNK